MTQLIAEEKPEEFKAQLIAETPVQIADLPQFNKEDEGPWSSKDIAKVKTDMDVFATSKQNVVNTLEWVPFAKYLVDTEREDFAQMSGEEQAAALAWEAFGVALWAGGGLLVKGAAKGVGKLAKFAKDRSLVKFKPIEDAIESIEQTGVWKGFDYNSTARRLIKNERFAGDEAEVIARVAGGEMGPEGLRSIAWEKSNKLSKAWKSRIGNMGDKLKDGSLRKNLDLDDDLRKLLAPENVRATHAKELYRQNLSLLGRGADKHNTEAIMKEQVRRLYGEQTASKLDLGHVSDHEMSNFISSMFEPQGRKIIANLHLTLGDTFFPWFKPERHLYGLGELVFKTKTRLFDKVVGAMRAANSYSVDKMNTLMAMLQQRGFGQIAKTARGWEFKPNKALWNQKTLTMARDVLQKIDNLSSVGRQGKLLTKDEAHLAIKEVLNQTRQESPAVFELVNMSKDYTDVLYKDMLQMYVPKIAGQASMNGIGKAKIAQLSKLWGTRADQMFSTASASNAADKIKLTKQMLKEFRKELTDPTNYDVGIPTDPQFKQLLGKLSYGSKLPGGMPAYLEGYFPRVAQRGSSFSGYVKRALVGASPFTKGRTMVTSRKLGSFQEIFEARTKSQGKQLFFYDEATEAVEYARTLPEAWQKHFDFTLGRMLNQPSNWDHKFAQILSRVPFVDEMDAFRAMRIAKTITGLQYSGMLGLRPFAVFRNLTQPILMTPPEMGGGIRDSVSLIRGLARAGTAKHREYIRSIGAITEFIPDQQIKPILPQMGALAQYNNIKDAFLYFFRQSDKMNRYWSGAAAVEKWNWAAQSTSGGMKNLSGFVRKVGLRHRADWSRTEIESLLKLGRYDEAKAAFVRDIIADTQYLYSTVDAPSAMGKGGVQRTLTTFQSWWMNYGNAISRWARTGEAEDRIKRMGTAMLTAAATEQILEAWAGRGTAIRSVGIGPFPIGDLGMPPAIQPIWQMLNAAKNATQGYAMNDQRSREKAKKAFEDSLKGAAKVVIPGGLAMQQSLRGYKEGEWPGLAMGILQKNPEKFKPLLGLVE